MDDLARWLGEQLDEDERIARAATRGPWCALNPDGAHGWTIGIMPHDPAVGIAHLPSRAEAAADATHIAAWDPARVLREIDAKRMIVAAHERRPMPNGDSADCAQCWGAVWPCPTLRLLALPYAGKPGYREEWAP